jgi:heme exporter protein B
LLLVGVVLLVLVAGLFYLPLTAWPAMLLTLVLGCVGYASISTFYAGMLARLRGREVLLPLLAFPLVVPVVLASVQATKGLAEGVDLAEVSNWWRLLAVFDVIYVAACGLLFPTILEG